MRRSGQHDGQHRPVAAAKDPPEGEDPVWTVPGRPVALTPNTSLPAAGPGGSERIVALTPGAETAGHPAEQRSALQLGIQH